MTGPIKPTNFNFVNPYQSPAKMTEPQDQVKLGKKAVDKDTNEYYDIEITNPNLEFDYEHLTLITSKGKFVYFSRNNTFSFFPNLRCELGVYNCRDMTSKEMDQFKKIIEEKYKVESEKISDSAALKELLSEMEKGLKKYNSFNCMIAENPIINRNCISFEIPDENIEVKYPNLDNEVTISRFKSNTAKEGRMAGKKVAGWQKITKEDGTEYKNCKEIILQWLDKIVPDPNDQHYEFMKEIAKKLKND